MPANPSTTFATAPPAWAVIAALICSACAGAPQPGPRPPEPAPVVASTERPERVVLVTIDTLRADYVGCYGSKLARTPTLDRMAATGVRFATAISPAPLTMPAHASLMTGLDPPLHGVHSNGKFRLRDEIPTLAEQFKAGGFATAGFVSAVVLDRRYGLARGFDFYGDQMGFRRNIRGQTGAYAERTADRVVDATLEWLDGAPDRFFLWVHFYDPHGNYDPPRGFRPASTGVPPDPNRVGILAYAKSVFPPLYAGEIYFADTELGRLMRGIRERWPGDRTLFVVTSDHGESLAEHDEITHTLTVYDATQKIPLLMVGPGLPRGRVVEAPVRLVDVAPTLLGLADLPPLAHSSGVDLRPWISGERGDALDAYVETLETHLAYGWSPVTGLRTERYKYLRTVRPELYDLTRDPHELRNLAAENAAIVEATLDELDAKLTARLENALPVAPNMMVADDDASLLEKLGYVVTDSDRADHPLGWVGGADPKDAIATFAKLLEARSRLAAGDPQRAREILAAEPEAGGWIAHARAEIALALGENDEAERLAREMIAAQPDQAEGYLTLGTALEARGLREPARAAFGEAARVNPNETESLVALGRLDEAEGELDAAAARYRAALDSNAPNADAALRLAALHFERGEVEEARAQLAEVGDAPGRPETAIHLARAQARAGYTDDAVARLKNSLALRGPNAELSEAIEELSRASGD